MIAISSRIHTRLGLVAALALMGVSACKNQGGANGGPGAAAGNAESCKQYAEALCGLAGGADSPTCGSIQTATDLMPPAACQVGLANIEHSKGRLAEARKVCDELVDKLCKEIGPETQTCDMVKGQTAKFPPERCTAMMGSYDQVLGQLKQMEAANKPLSDEQQDKIAAEDAPAFGPKDAKITIVEFSDFQCPYCTRAANAVKQIKEKYGDKVRFVFRQFPLSFHQNAHAAAQASLAANAQGKFWQYHDILFENQSALSDADLEKHAQKAGLNISMFKKALKDGTYKQQVDNDLKLGEQVAVNGTPTMFLNGKRVANPTAFDAISELIERELASATN